MKKVTCEYCKNEFKGNRGLHLHWLHCVAKKFVEMPIQIIDTDYYYEVLDKSHFIKLTNYLTVFLEYTYNHEVGILKDKRLVLIDPDLDMPQANGVNFPKNQCRICMAWVTDEEMLNHENKHTGVVDAAGEQISIGDIISKHSFKKAQELSNSIDDECRQLLGAAFVTSDFTGTSRKSWSTSKFIQFRVWLAEKIGGKYLHEHCDW
jgi:hypothetical protein